MIDFLNLDADLSHEDRLAFVKRKNSDLSDEQVEAYFASLLHRREKKQELLERGFSNRLAEKFLDRTGLPRPWGWHTVFFYPDSNVPRARYVIIGIAIIAYVFWRGSLR